jgi:hypothetical protein
MSQAKSSDTDALELARRLSGNFAQYAGLCLKIADKRGQQVPLRLNKAQHYIHAKLEEQKRTTGRVRALILKGRQQGVSTYVEARFLWTLHWNIGRKAVVMAHQAASTAAIFGMVQRYAKNIPEIIRPKITRDASGTLEFGEQDCGYRVATAGSDAVGRGWTAQMLHGSEFGFWDKADEHFSGIGQAIAEMPDTEVILESTANKVGDEFHQRWQDAQAGRGDYIAVFVPWYWQAEYTRPLDSDLTADEVDYLSRYLADGMTPEHMAWRRSKIEGDFGGDVEKFMREYPSDASEAFMASDDTSLIKADAIATARRAEIDEETLTAPVLIGVDPARYGDDSTAIVVRQGRKMLDLKRVNGLSTMQVVGVVHQYAKEFKPDAVLIDVGGLGAGVVDRLHELNYENVFGVNFGEKALSADKYVNRRSEMWCLMRDWINAQPTKITNDDTLAADLSAPSYSYDSHGRVKLETKDDMRKRGIKSPDAGDALALTFALPFNAVVRREREIFPTAARAEQYIGDSYAGY